MLQWAGRWGMLYPAWSRRGGSGNVYFAKRWVMKSFCGLSCVCLSNPGNQIRSQEGNARPLIMSMCVPLHVEARHVWHEDESHDQMRSVLWWSWANIFTENWDIRVLPAGLVFILFFSSFNQTQGWHPKHDIMIVPLFFQSQTFLNFPFQSLQTMISAPRMVRVIEPNGGKRRSFVPAENWHIFWNLLHTCLAKFSGAGECRRGVVNIFCKCSTAKWSDSSQGGWP